MPSVFKSDGWLNLNQQRLEHLASLQLPIDNKGVIELGAGEGDLTEFFLSRNCRVVSIEGRKENVVQFEKRHPQVPIIEYDLDKGMPGPLTASILFSYGLLYHLTKPLQAIRSWAKSTKEMLLLSTCVSFGSEASIKEKWVEDVKDFGASLNGYGYHPTREWVFSTLRDNFPYVYTPLSQPNNRQFLRDWKTPPPYGGLYRAVFVASQSPLKNPRLVEGLPETQLSLEELERQLQ